MMMIMHCFCGMVDRRKVFSPISSQDLFQRSLPLRILYTSRAGFELAQNFCWMKVYSSDIFATDFYTTEPWHPSCYWFSNGWIEHKEGVMLVYIISFALGYFYTTVPRHSLCYWFSYGWIEHKVGIMLVYIISFALGYFWR